MNDRTISLIGEENFKKLQNTTVLIVGLGGVGGTSFESLIRSGIKNITIVDHDTFDETNLNRQILSNTMVIGQKKTEVCLNRALSINNEAQINIIDEFLNKDNIDVLNKYNYDYIIDACDTVDTKVLLIKYALEHNIKIISSMGTGKRIDPTKIKISKLNKTFNDPLAKVMRKKLKDNNINSNVPVVFSEELPIDTNNVIGSMMIVPSTAGLYLASFIINDVISKKE